MRPFKLLVAVTAAAVMGGALAAPASGGRLRIAEELFVTGPRRLDFSGGFGTVECEISLTHLLHERVIAKVARSLIGNVISGEFPRCARGGATVLRETLPWHIQYESFTGTLPLISRVSTNIIGMTITIREPTFGIVCSAQSTAAEPVHEVFNLAAGGGIASYTFSGTVRTSCNINGTVSGTGNIIVPENNRFTLI